MVHEGYESATCVSDRPHMGGEGQHSPVPQTKTEEILSVLPVGTLRGESFFPPHLA